MRYNPMSHALQFDPWSTYRWLLEEQPVYHDEELQFWALSRYDDVLAALLAPEVFSSSKGVTLEGLEQGTDMLICKDDPEHAWHRAAVARLFGARTIRNLEVPIRRTAAGLLSEASEKGFLDVGTDFAALLPMEIISELVGIPPTLRRTIYQLSQRITSQDAGDGTATIPEDAMVAAIELAVVFMELVADRRKNPQDDMLTALVQAPVVNSEGGSIPVSDEQLAARLVELVIAGHETTAKLITSSVVMLSWYDDARKQLASDPTLWPDAVEEMVRLHPTAHYVGRWTMTDTALHGVRIPAGQRVLLVLAAAGRDPRAHVEPEIMDIHRAIGRQLGFGAGPHACIGASLARLECRIALEELLAWCPDFAVDETSVVRAFGSNVQGLRRVVIRPT